MSHSVKTTAATTGGRNGIGPEIAIKATAGAA